MREIGRETIAEVDRKVRAIRRPDGVSVRTALVYDGHLSPLAASDGYFEAVVPFGKLLGLGQPRAPRPPRRSAPGRRRS